MTVWKILTSDDLSRFVAEKRKEPDDVYLRQVEESVLREAIREHRAQLDTMVNRQQCIALYQHELKRRGLAYEWVEYERPNHG
jgi:(p)ppGpp synthase/HD superfamily hydrolase